MNEVWRAGVILIVIISVIMAIPCVCTIYLGRKMLKKLAYFPSKNPAIQMNIIMWLVIVEIVSFVLLFVFYQIFISEDTNKGAKNYERLDADITVSCADGHHYRDHHLLPA